MNLFKPALLLVLFAVLPGMVLAHHSFATYDMTRTETLEGTVRKLEWMNPHMWLWIDVPNSHGGVSPWGFEGGPISVYARAGWKPDMMKRGDKIKVEFHPLKSGQPAGSLSRVWYKGKELSLRQGGTAGVSGAGHASQPSASGSGPWRSERGRVDSRYAAGIHPWESRYEDIHVIADTAAGAAPWSAPVCSYVAVVDFAGHGSAGD